MLAPAPRLESRGGAGQRLARESRSPASYSVIVIVAFMPPA